MIAPVALHKVESIDTNGHVPAVQQRMSLHQRNTKLTSPKSRCPAVIHRSTSVDVTARPPAVEAL
jgi:hypothetical protein